MKPITGPVLHIAEGATKLGNGLHFLSMGIGGDGRCIQILVIGLSEVEDHAEAVVVAVRARALGVLGTPKSRIGKLAVAEVPVEYKGVGMVWNGMCIQSRLWEVPPGRTT